MSKPIIAAWYKIAPWQEKYVKSKLPKAKHAFFTDSLSPATIRKVKNSTVLCSFVSVPTTERAIAAMPNLRLIATQSTGFDHVDLAAAAKRKIVVSNVPFYGENTVAEHAFALLLTLSKRIPEATERTRHSNFSPKDLTGFDLEGKTFGIVGLGHIGQHAAQIAHGFGMRIVAFDLYPDKVFAKKYGIKYVSLPQLLQTADVISLHAPYNSHTHHLINAKNIRLIKKGAVLINTARGGLIETKAMYDALVRGQLAGVGLDVLEEENVLGEDVGRLAANSKPKDSLLNALIGARLADHPRAVITPHNAFNTREALQRIIDTTIGNITSWAKGKPSNVVKIKSVKG